jgi:hypothetical protein
MLRRLTFIFLTVAFLFTILSPENLAQPQGRKLQGRKAQGYQPQGYQPQGRQYTVSKPRQRKPKEPIKMIRRMVEPANGILAVVLDPVINGLITIKDEFGDVVTQLEAGEDGQEEVPLRKGKTYQIEVTAPNYRSASVTMKGPFTSNSAVQRLKLNPEFVGIEFLTLPPNSQIYIDDKLKKVTEEHGPDRINDVEPGTHRLLIRHPEYNDYTYELENLKAGTTVTFPPMLLTRLAKLTIEGPPGASILIDGTFKARIEPDGKVRIDYPLEEAAEHRIAAELTGYQTWSSRQTLNPGTHIIKIKMDPVTTSTGVSDFFENMSQWKAPSTWKIGSDQKLQVGGEQLGTLAGKKYRNFQGVFTVWLCDGKGASWAVRADPEGRNYYLFHLSGPDSTAPKGRRFYTYVVKDGGDPVEVSTRVPVMPELNTKTSYTISFKVRGYTIEHKITSNETGETDDLGIWTDESSLRDSFLYGTFGFRSLFGEVFCVDDLSLEPLKQD